MGSSQADYQAQPCWRRAGWCCQRFLINTHFGKLIWGCITCWQIQRAARSLGFRPHGDVLFRGVWPHWGCGVLECRYTWYPLCWQGCSPHLHVDPHSPRLGETCQSKTHKQIYRVRVGDSLGNDDSFVTPTTMQGRFLFYFNGQQSSHLSKFIPMALCDSLPDL